MVFALAGVRPTDGAKPAAGQAGDVAQRVVVVELFTSQGCSSCPSADRVLAALSQEERSRVVTLAFHVDYWNYIGWRDPFSSERWTRRQQDYAGAFDTRRVYTPQAIVDGKTDVVGSDGAALRRAIASHAQDAGGSITIRMAGLPGSAQSVDLHVVRPESLVKRPLDLVVALFEDGLVTNVGSGENAARTLRNERVVRELKTVASLPAGTAAADARVEFTVDPKWNRARLGVAAFLQDPATMAIEGAAAAPWSQ